MSGYGSDQDFAAWAAARGYDLPAGVTIAALREIGSDYIDATYGPRFVGQKSGGYAQAREWPRDGVVTVAGEALADGVTPDAVERATYAAAWIEAQSSGSLTVTGSRAGLVAREKVDVLEVSYQAADSKAALGDLLAVRSTAIDGLLWPFLRPERRGGVAVGIIAVGR